MKKILILALLLTLFCITVSASFEDMPDNWSTAALQSAVDNGLLRGSEGHIYPDKALTRAEMAAITVRAFGVEKQADVSAFIDMSADKWYYGEMAKAVAMGAFKGDGDKLSPDAPITREQAFTVVARVLSVTSRDMAVLEKFEDGGKVSDWAKESVAGLVQNGYVNGSNGKLSPQSSITRAEFAQIMYNVVKHYISENVTSKTYDGNIVIKGNVTVKNVTVNGDVIVAEGVSDLVKLENVTVNGRIVFRSGNGSSIDGSFESVVVTGDGLKITASSSTKIGSQTVLGSNSFFTQRKPSQVITPSIKDEAEDKEDNKEDNNEEIQTPEVEDDKGSWSGWYQ